MPACSWSASWAELPLDGLNPSTLIFTHGFNVKASQQIVRRLISIVVSFMGLVICLPFIPFIILAVRLSSPGPIFFRQTRVGLRGRPFSLIKFRTMRQDAEANGAVWATKNDSRVTPLGNFMRKTRLDEIPQLWNVLRGEMGFVGPRPERPEFVQWLTREIPFYELRHMIRPGITGWAQVRYQYGASLEETKRSSNTISTTSSTCRSVLTCSSCLRRSRPSCCEGAPSEDRLLAVADRHSLHLRGISLRDVDACAAAATALESRSDHSQREYRARRA